MTRLRNAFLLVLAVGLGLATAGRGEPQAQEPEMGYRLALPAVASDSAAFSQQPPRYNEGGVRYCEYVPGFSTPAVMPPGTGTSAEPPAADPTLPTPVGPGSQTPGQLERFEEVWETIRDEYVFPDLRGLDWEAIHTQYGALIAQGLTEAGFDQAMKALVGELGDDHSSYMSAAEVAQEAADLAAGADYAGIGVLAQLITPGAGAATILEVFPGSPAALAGLQPHDTILSVDGGPVLLTPTGNNLRGPEGTSVTLVVTSPGGNFRSVTITRARVTGKIPLQYCLVANTGIGYIQLLGMLDPEVDDQVRAAMAHLGEAGPLLGVILDNRANGGGREDVAESILGLFSSGVHGHLVGPGGTLEFKAEGAEISGSRAVPLLVLVGQGTASYGEILSGVLGHSGRATVMGTTTRGNVELLRGWSLSGGAKLWLAGYTFKPPGLVAGIWEETGIVPDVAVPSRWDLYREGTDPGMAAGVGLLMVAN